MKITAVETLRSPEQPNVCLVALHADDGSVGVGESFFAARTVEAYLHEVAAPLLLDLDDPAPERAVRLLRPYVGYSSSGAEMRGNGAVDIALWDLLGAATGQPLAALLGGVLQQSMPVYNTCAGYSYVRDEPRQAVSNWGLPGAQGSPERPYEDLEAFLHRPGELARSLLGMGVQVMKVWPFDQAADASGGTHIGVADLRSGLSVLDRIRDAVGDEMEIMVEMHGQWNLPAATRILRALADYHPFWVEDPLRPDGVDAYRRLRDATAVPIATGETLAGRRAFKPLLESGAIDVAIVDIGWTGGVTEARKIASMAETYDVAFAPHDCTGPVSFAACVQMAASQPNALIQENVRAFYTDWYGRLVDGLPLVRDGRVHLSDRPGLGVSLRPDLPDRPGVRRVVSDRTAQAALR